MSPETGCRQNATRPKTPLQTDFSFPCAVARREEDRLVWRRMGFTIKSVFKAENISILSFIFTQHNIWGFQSGERREIHRQVYRQTGLQADRFTGRQGYRQTGLQADRVTGRQGYRQTGLQADRFTGRQGYRQTGLQADRFPAEND